MKLRIALSVLGVLAVSTLPLRADPLVKDGELVVFMGDSITQQGAGSAGGYVRLVESGLLANGITIKVFPSGVSGDKSTQMLARLGFTALDKGAQWMTLSCGVNDVWHLEQGSGLTVEEYAKNITEIVDRAQAAGMKVLIMTATLIGPDLNGKMNVAAQPYNEFLREFAKARNLPLADLNADMRKEWAAIQAAKSAKKLTVDGVHMGPAGNKLMARGVLRAFGLNPAEMARAEAYWDAHPEMVPVVVRGSFSVPEMDALQELALARKVSLDEMLAEWLSATAKRELAKQN